MLEPEQSIPIKIEDPTMVGQLLLIAEKIKLITRARKRLYRLSRFFFAGAIVGGLMSLVGLVFSSNVFTGCSAAITCTLFPVCWLLSRNSKKWQHREEALIKELEAFHAKMLDEKFEQLIQDDD